MSASPVVRSLRAAVFAVLCVLLATAGHALAMGGAPPVWLQLASGVPVFLAGCLFSGRERSLTGIGGGTLAVQGGLHFVFDAARPHAVTAMQGMRMSTADAHAHALTPHATAAHAGAAVVLTWWLRRGEAALWALLRWAVACVPGLAAWWQVAKGARGGPVLPRPVRRFAHETRPSHRLRLRYAVHRRGPPEEMSYVIRP
ncbi:hypothetical protein ACFYRY_05285 [Streptomyces sp. NPDC005263]|uniref:hypothetical protein n=1 Tax=Streptomyces sp. NPDC005263 TaxID=3364711 RepID=UPI00367E0E81